MTEPQPTPDLRGVTQIIRRNAPPRTGKTPLDRAARGRPPSVFQIRSRQKISCIVRSDFSTASFTGVAYVEQDGRGIRTITIATAGGDHSITLTEDSPRRPTTAGSGFSATLDKSGGPTAIVVIWRNGWDTSETFFCSRASVARLVRYATSREGFRISDHDGRIEAMWPEGAT